MPAQYGDATGGIISVTTKGPSSRFGGGLEIESSSLFDKYNYNLVGFGLSGPILKKEILTEQKEVQLLVIFFW